MSQKLGLEKTEIRNITKVQRALALKSAGSVTAQSILLYFVTNYKQNDDLKMFKHALCPQTSKPNAFTTASKNVLI